MKTWEADSAQRLVKHAPFLISSSVFGLFLLSLGWFYHFQLSIQFGLGGSWKETAEPRRAFAWCWYSMSQSVAGTHYEGTNPLKWNKMKLLLSQVKNQVHRSKCSINTDTYGSILLQLQYSPLTIYIISTNPYTSYFRHHTRRTRESKNNSFIAWHLLFGYDSESLYLLKGFFVTIIKHIYVAIHSKFVVLSWFGMLYCWIFHMNVKCRYNCTIEDCSNTSNCMNFFIANSHTFISL